MLVANPMYLFSRAVGVFLGSRLRRSTTTMLYGAAVPDPARVRGRASRRRSAEAAQALHHAVRVAARMRHSSVSVLLRRRRSTTPCVLRQGIG